MFCWSDNNESHAKKERPDSQTRPQVPSGRSSESIDTNSVYSEPMVISLSQNLNYLCRLHSMS